MIQSKLKDKRNILIDLINEKGIYGTVNGIRSRWEKDGKWREDGIESKADIIMNIQLTLNI